MTKLKQTRPPREQRPMASPDLLCSSNRDSAKHFVQPAIMDFPHAPIPTHPVLSLGAFLCSGKIDSMISKIKNALMLHGMPTL